MEEESEAVYSYFVAALKEKAQEHGYGIHTVWAIDAGVGNAIISQVLSGKKRAGFDTQVRLARACGYDYIGFLQHGKFLVTGENLNPGPLPIKEAREFLALNKRDQGIVLKLIGELFSTKGEG